ncbi:MAG TPA: preprotein translocase subunit SecA [Candidatus Paceibacterota bacterium]|nr:preprotein translocase subunit SecA [Candidatus Paceibacterota bacterium]
MLEKLFGSPEKRAVKKYASKIAEINTLEKKYEPLSLEQLKDEAIVLKKEVQAEGRSLDSVLTRSFALTREAAKRTLGQRHYDVQLVGGLVLNSGAIAEMKTGEGKTLVATLPVFLNSLAGKGVHVVTVNDYLARRDGVWMGQIYNALGMTVGVINGQASYLYDPTHVEADEHRDEVAAFKVVYEFLKPCTRREAYQADITYGTNSEFGFDYLRDNIEYDKRNLRQRGHPFSIVDEIDSILIDEARTPLIISAPAQESENLYARFSQIADRLKEEEHYTVDEKHHQIALTDAGIREAEKQLGVENIYTDAGIKYAYHLETAVKAKALYKREKEYVVRDNEVIIVDEYTGRLQPGRRWSGGIHQAVEAKEGVLVQRETRTFASITYQNYFRLYEKLGGMTGTAYTSREEFFKVYGLDTVPIPTNRPVVRDDKNDLIFQTEHGKFTALAKHVKKIHQTGQPVLIGTVSIEKNEELSEYLKVAGVPHQMLNAKNHEREGEIVAEAGKKGAVTVATNMAGRGVDIKLGGAMAPKELSEEVKSLGGLHVIGTERHTARRIDNQLRGRSGRQGDPGSTQFFVAFDDMLMRVFAADTVKKMIGRLGLPEDEAIQNRMLSRSLESAQTKIEGINFDSRKQTLQYDDILNHQRKIMYERRRKLLTAEGDEVLEIAKEFLTKGDYGVSVEEVDKVIEDRVQALGKEEASAGIRRLLLQTNDMLWIDHLEEMEYLRSSVNLRSYGQRDPLIEYKREGLRIFKSMQSVLISQVMETIPRIGAGAFAKEEKAMEDIERKATFITDDGSGGVSKSGGETHGEELGRNDKIIVRKGGEQKEIKFKHLDKYLKDGWQR